MPFINSFETAPFERTREFNINREKMHISEQEALMVVETPLPNEDASILNITNNFFNIQHTIALYGDYKLISNSYTNSVKISIDKKLEELLANEEIGYPSAQDILKSNWTNSSSLKSIRKRTERDLNKTLSLLEAIEHLSDFSEKKFRTGILDFLDKCTNAKFSANGLLYFEVHNVNIEYDGVIYELGDYECKINLINTRIDIDARDTCSYNGYIHPHVSREICLGGFLKGYILALADLDFVSAAEKIEGALRSYNPNSCFDPIEEFGDFTRCNDCDCNLRDVEIISCDECNEAFCCECISVCSTCGENCCGECAKDNHTNCSGCDDIVCNNCFQECTECGNAYCNDCSEKCTECGTVVCNNCSKECTKCGKIYCNDCSEECSECKDEYCLDCLRLCSKCGQPLCPDCLDSSPSETCR